MTHCRKAQMKKYIWFIFNNMFYTCGLDLAHRSLLQTRTPGYKTAFQKTLGHITHTISKFLWVTLFIFRTMLNWQDRNRKLWVILQSRMSQKAQNTKTRHKIRTMKFCLLSNSVDQLLYISYKCFWENRCRIVWGHRGRLDSCLSLFLYIW